MEIDEKKVIYAMTGYAFGFITGFTLTMIIPKISLAIVLIIVAYFGLKIYMLYKDKKRKQRY